MGGIVPKAPKPDNSLLLKQQEQQREAELRAEQERLASEDTATRLRRGKRSLLGAESQSLGVA